MMVMSIIGTIALVAQIYIIRLISRSRRNASPPAFVERLASNKKDKERLTEMTKCRELAALHKKGRSDKATPKFSEEKELMLDDQNLGLTTLGRDARLADIKRPYPSQPCDQYVTLPRDRYNANLKDVERLHQSRTLPKNSRPATVRFKTTPEPYIPNGTAGRRTKDQRPSGCSNVIETSLSKNVHETSSAKAGSSAYEAVDCGYRSSLAPSPRVGKTKENPVGVSDWKKCISWIDRSVSFVISAAVIFAIMIFIILFLAT